MRQKFFFEKYGSEYAIRNIGITGGNGRHLNVDNFHFPVGLRRVGSVGSTNQGHMYIFI